MIATRWTANSAPGTLNQLFFDGRREVQQAGRAAGQAQRPVHADLARDLARSRAPRALGLGSSAFAPATASRFSRRIGPSGRSPTTPASRRRHRRADLSESAGEQIGYILRDSGAVAIFVSTRSRRRRSPRSAASAARCDTSSAFGASDRRRRHDARRARDGGRGGRRRRATRRRFGTRALAVRPDDLATIIYTSGTTGEPKGRDADPRQHLLERHGGARGDPVRRRRHVPQLSAAVAHLRADGRPLFDARHAGTSIAYAESIDTVPLNMTEVRPTLVLSVPRLYEKMYARVLENALAGGAVKKRIFFWARGVADRWADVKLAGGEPRGLLAAAVPPRAAARVLEAASAHGRTAALLRVGRRAARAGDQQVLLRRRAGDSRGLRAHGDVAGDRA